MSSIPVLVTGGAGYIGSHAVLALRDAGWPVSVIDDLSTGSRYLLPDDVPFYEGNVADRAFLGTEILEDLAASRLGHRVESVGGRRGASHEGIIFP